MARKAGDIDSHRLTHQKDGSDEIDLAGLKGIPNSPKISVGSYIGNGRNNRQIPTGFKCSFVLILSPTEPKNSCLMIQGANPIRISDGEMLTNGTRFHHTDGFIVCTSEFNNRKNVAYCYWAISVNGGLKE